MHELVTRFAKLLKPLGLDLIKPFQVKLYNQCVTSEQHKLPDFGRQSCLALLIGNTRNFWKPFLLDFKTHNKSPDPVDDYVERCIQSVLTQAAGNVKCFVKFSHERQDGKIVAIQRACHVSGLAYYDTENSYLCIHPVYGPWIALRAVVVIDAPVNS